MARPEDDSRITATENLFTYHIFGTPRHLEEYGRDTSAPFLTVSGMVDPAVQLSLDQIRTQFEAVSAPMVLQCMTNVHWGRIRFTGARLLDVLEFAGMPDEALKLAIHGEDGFDADLFVEEIRRRPDAHLLAYEMNGEPLTVDHGFPLRLTSDGRYGYKWPKWVREIEAVDYDFKGHYEGKRGWSDEGARGTRVT